MPSRAATVDVLYNAIEMLKEIVDFSAILFTDTEQGARADVCCHDQSSKLPDAHPKMRCCFALLYSPNLHSN